MTPSRWKKLLFTATAIVVLVGCWWQPVDRGAQPLLQQSFQRALGAFGVARALNGVISLVQGSDVAVQPAGVGVSLAVGEILDPVNDLVERFSWLMLAASTVIGLQILLSAIFASPWLNLALSGAAVIAVLPWLTDRRPRRPARIALQVAIVLATLRFLFPVTALVEDALYHHYLAGRSQHALEALEATTARLKATAEPDPPTPSPAGAAPVDKGWWDRMSGRYHSMTESLDIPRQIDRYQGAVADASEHVIDLMVAFVLETLLLPLLAALLAVAIIRSAVRSAFRELAEPKGEPRD